MANYKIGQYVSDSTEYYTSTSVSGGFTQGTGYAFYWIASQATSTGQLCFYNSASDYELLCDITAGVAGVYAAKPREHDYTSLKVRVASGTGYTFETITCTNYYTLTELISSSLIDMTSLIHVGIIYNDGSQTASNIYYTILNNDTVGSIPRYRRLEIEGIEITSLMVFPVKVVNSVLADVDFIIDYQGAE